MNRAHGRQVNFRGPSDLLDRFKETCDKNGEYIGPTIVRLIQLYCDSNGDLSAVTPSSAALTTTGKPSLVVPPDPIMEGMVAAFRRVIRTAPQDARNVFYMVLQQAERPHSGSARAD